MIGLLVIVDLEQEIDYVLVELLLSNDEHALFLLLIIGFLGPDSL